MLIIIAVVAIKSTKSEDDMPSDENASDRNSDIYYALSLPDDDPPDYSMTSPSDKVAKVKYNQKSDNKKESKEKGRSVKTKKRVYKEDEDWVDELNFFDLMDDD